MIFEIRWTTGWTKPCEKCYAANVPASPSDKLYEILDGAEKTVQIWLVDIQTAEDLQEIQEETGCELVVFSNRYSHGYPIIEIYNAFRE